MTQAIAQGKANQEGEHVLSIVLASMLGKRRQAGYYPLLSRMGTCLLTDFRLWSCR